MTIDKNTAEKIREMYTEGVPKRQIAKKLLVTVNTVTKYIKDDNNEKTMDEKGEVKKLSDLNKLEEELQVVGLQTEIQEHLLMAIGFLEDTEEPSVDDKKLLNKAYFLQYELENADNIETVQWIETKCDEIVQQVFENMERKADKAKEEEEKRAAELKKQKEQKKQRLRKSLEATLIKTDELLVKPFSNEEKQDIFNSVMPRYEQPRSEIAGALRRTLGNHILDPEQRDTVMHLWYQNYV